MDSSPDSLDSFANIDYDRTRRCGFPEVVYGEGKTAEQVSSICGSLLERNSLVMVTRLDATKAEEVRGSIPDAVYLETPRILFVDRRGSGNGIGGAAGESAGPARAMKVAGSADATGPASCEGAASMTGPASSAKCTADVLATVERSPETGNVVVCCAGTSDLYVAEEAAVTACLMGSHVQLIPDIGVAGVHRTLEKADELRQARAIVCCAGMEGALPSLVAGLVDVPVIAVPTSVGYGANLGGVAALLSMINSCSGGVSVVNIDNGFGAGQIAHRINRPSWLPREGSDPR